MNKISSHSVTLLSNRNFRLDTLNNFVQLEILNFGSTRQTVLNEFYSRTSTPNCVLLRILIIKLDPLHWTALHLQKSTKLMILLQKMTQSWPEILWRRMFSNSKNQHAE